MAVSIKEMAHAIEEQLGALEAMRRYLPPFDVSEADRLQRRVLELHAELGELLSRVIDMNAIAVGFVAPVRTVDAVKWARAIQEEAAGELRLSA